jgi:predicted nucleic acid-binding protein
MLKVFVDTDVCLDLLSGRKPFNHTAELLFSLADKGKMKLFVSSLSFSNIDYVLRSTYSTVSSRQTLSVFKTLVQVLPVDSKTIDLALASDFSDFEDAIQHSCALENNLTILVTRNTKDFKKSSLQVLLPESLLAVAMG